MATQQLIIPPWLSIAVISSDSHNRDTTMSALDRFPDVGVAQYMGYPRDAGEVAVIREQQFDVIFVDITDDTERGIELIYNLASDGKANVIVYSAKLDSDLLVRCMRAGVREFLPMPLTADTVAEALARVSARLLEERNRNPAMRDAIQRRRGRLLMFASAKGGAGATTLSCILAVSLAQEFGQRTLLIDLNFPLGDAALTLGLSSQYSTITALEHSQRLDGRLLSSLLVHHESGLHVLAGPTDMTPAGYGPEAIFKLIETARQEFDYLVVDAGSRLLPLEAYSLDEMATIFLVTQVGTPELRNSSRLIEQLEGRSKLEVILNRFDAKVEGVSEDLVKRSLKRPVQWRVPNDYAAVRNMQNLGTPLNRDDSEIALTIRKMCESISGLRVLEKPKKKGIFNLF